MICLDCSILLVQYRFLKNAVSLAGATAAILSRQQELTQAVDVFQQPANLKRLETFDRNAQLSSLLVVNNKLESVVRS